MMRALLLSRVRLTRRAWTHRHARGGWVRHPAVAVLVAAWMGGFVLAGLRALFGALAAAGASPRELAALLALVLSATLAALVVFDVDDAVRTLVSDSDLELLRRSPIPPRTLLALKALDAAPRAAMPMLVLALPALVAFAAQGGGGPLFWAAAIVVLAALWVTPLSIGAALSLLVLRAVPAARAREALGLLATLTLTLLWAATAIVAPRVLQTDPTALPGLRAALARALENPGPAAAAAQAMAAAARGDVRSVARELGWLVAGAALATLAALAVAHAALPAVLDRLAGSGTRERPAARGAPSRPFAWRTRGIARAIVRRDGRMLRRSWTLLGDLAVASGLWTLLPLAGAARLELPWSPLARLMLLTISVGLGYEIAARSMPFERHAHYWSRLAPVEATRWLAGKLAGSALLAIPVVTAVGLSLAIARPIATEALGPAACLAIAALALSLASGLWAGVVFGDPEWINPRAMLRLSGRLMTSGLLLVEIGFWLGIAALLDLRTGGRWGPIWAGVPLIGAGLAIVPFRLASGRLAARDSSH
jgi:hypothetical protein